VLEHRAAIDWALRALVDPEHGVLTSVSDIEAVGHRVVHGGEEFASSVLMTPDVVAKIEACSVPRPAAQPRKSARLPRRLRGAPEGPPRRGLRHRFPPDHARARLPLRNPVPALHQATTSAATVSTGPPTATCPIAAVSCSAGAASDRRVITAHLGNGCSVAAIDRGRSIDTSMGFTPLEGLLMGTRSGDMDPAIIPWLMAMEELTLHQMNTMLNKHSGLYGVSGVSSDMREVLEARARGRRRADVAFRMFCYRVKKYVGAYAARWAASTRCS